MGRKQHPLASRIKKLMQTDEEVGKIASATPVLIGAWPYPAREPESINSNSRTGSRTQLRAGGVASAEFVHAGTAVELFVKELCEGSRDIALERSAKTMSASHLCAPRLPVMAPADTRHCPSARPATHLLRLVSRATPRNDLACVPCSKCMLLRQTSALEIHLR